MTPEELKDRTCSFEDCRHLNSENICCIHNQENCVLYRTKRELEEVKANADYQLEGRDLKIKELEAQIVKMQCCENCAFFKDKTYDICHRIKKLGTRKCAFYKMV